MKMLEGLDGDKGSVCGNAGGVRWGWRQCV